MRGGRYYSTRKKTEGVRGLTGPGPGLNKRKTADGISAICKQQAGGRRQQAEDRGLWSTVIGRRSILKWVKTAASNGAQHPMASGIGAMCEIGGGELGGLAPGSGPLSWVIVGGESGGLEHRRLVEAHRYTLATRWRPKPKALQWVRSLRDQCQAAGVPFFFKQWGGPTPHSGGSLLDGREWKEIPQE